MSRAYIDSEENITSIFTIYPPIQKKIYNTSQHKVRKIDGAFSDIDVDPIELLDRDENEILLKKRIAELEEQLRSKVVADEWLGPANKTHKQPSNDEEVIIVSEKLSEQLPKLKDKKTSTRSKINESKKSKPDASASSQSRKSSSVPKKNKSSESKKSSTKVIEIDDESIVINLPKVEDGTRLFVQLYTPMPDEEIVLEQYDEPWLSNRGDYIIYHDDSKYLDVKVSDREGYKKVYHTSGKLLSARMCWESLECKPGSVLYLEKKL